MSAVLQSARPAGPGEWRRADPIAAAVRGDRLDLDSVRALTRSWRTADDGEPPEDALPDTGDDALASALRRTAAGAHESRRRVLDGDAAAVLDLAIGTGLVAALRRPAPEVAEELLELIDAAAGRLGCAPRPRPLPAARRALAEQVVTDLTALFAELLPGRRATADRLRSLRTALLIDQPAAGPGSAPPGRRLPPEPPVAERPATHLQELARLSSLLVDTIAWAAGTDHSLDAVSLLPAELPTSARHLGARRGLGQRLGWLEHELAHHHTAWAADAPPPRVLVDVPVARLVAPNAACFPQPDGSAVIAVASAGISDPAPMTRRGQAFLSLLAAHEGIPGHALQHWLASTGPNAAVASGVADPYAVEGWAMAVEFAVGRLAGGGLRVVAAYHALRRLVPATVLALRECDGDTAARSWLADLLGRSAELATEITRPGRFESHNVQHYAVGLVRTFASLPTAARMGPPVPTELRARLALGRYLPDPEAKGADCR